MHTHCLTRSKYCNCLIWAARLFRKYLSWGQGLVFKFQLDGTVSHQRPCSKAIGCSSVLTHLPLCALLHIRASHRPLLAPLGHAKKLGPSDDLHCFICEVKEMFKTNVYFVVLFSGSDVGLVNLLYEETLHIYNKEWAKETPRITTLGVIICFHPKDSFLYYILYFTSSLF